MAQSGWRLPDDLLRRVRVRAAETGVRQNVFVERALESALGCSDVIAEAGSVERASGPGRSAPSRAPVSNFDRLQGAQPVPTVKRASSLGMDRQARLNAAREKKAKGS